jgi:hypothetical protein
MGASMLLSIRSLAPMQRVAFNTGAYYSPHGQRIGIWLRDVPEAHLQLCCLVDFDRGITGHFPVRLTSSLHSAEDLARHAKYMYDMGQYELGCPQPIDAAIRTEVLAVLDAGYQAFVGTPGTHELFGRFDRNGR